MIGGVTCPNCGKDNPDFLDNCQFCQTALRRESTLNIGENPTKKVTGELEAVLPDWLRDARQQGRDSAEEDAKKEDTKPKVQEEPTDLLAGLAFQAASDEDEVPDWLAAINPVEKKSPASSKSAEEEPVDFFAQFNQPASDSSMPGLGGISQDEAPSQIAGIADDIQKDELTDWFSQAPEQSGEPVSSEPEKPAEPEDLGWLHELESSAKQSAPSSASKGELDWMSNFDSSSAQASGPQDDLSWLNNLGGTPVPSFNEPAPSQPGSSQEDLSWLNNLGGIPVPSNEPAPAQPTSPQEDLSWLNELGGTPAPSFNEPAPAQPASSTEDLDWLSNLGGTPAPSFNEPAPAQPTSSQEDLDWLSNLGGTPASSFNESSPAQPASSTEDLNWLNDLGGTPASAQPASSQEDLDWLSNLGSTSAPSFNEPAPSQPESSQEDLDWLSNLSPAAPASDESAPSPFAKTDQLQSPDNPPDATVSPFAPGYTGPLRDEVAQTPMPDWLKEAAEGSMPPPGAASMDWLTSKDKPADELSFPPSSDQTQDLFASVDQAAAVSASDSSSLSNQDIDSLFAVDMPDWLSQPDTSTGATSVQGNIPSGTDDSLAPVNLPSWVQAMRPVEAAIGEASAISVDQNTEQQGPLAGFRGVIPFAPIGSAQRPKAISLKLQATEEQQTTAALLEQILASETTAHPLITTPFVASQRILRWALTVLFLVVLGVMIGLGSQIMPVTISNTQMTEISNMATTLQGIPEGAPVLVVMDYEPALVGEMEASAGPLLDQIVVARRPNLTFIATSPNGAGLIERLMASTRITELGYQPDSQYFNIGYLPGGSAGVHGFIEQPQNMMPAVRVNLFSEFAAVLVITDHAESGLVWIEQVELMKQSNPALANQPLLIVASAQAGPLLQPYVSSKQVNGMISGLSDASRYEFMNNSRPGIARSYWDAFGVGLFMAVLAIVLGSLWSLFMGIRSRRAKAEQG